MFPGQEIQLILNGGAGTSLKGLQPCHDQFSDGDPYKETCLGIFPVEMVPTPDKISSLNRYFRKTAVLIRKKPCNLAGFGSVGKMAQFTGHPEPYPASGMHGCPKKSPLPGLQ
jgi:hypothetical protein